MKLKTWVLLGADAAMVCGVLLYGFWVALPHFFCHGDVLLAGQTPVRTYYDGRGEVLLREPTYDGQWRLDVPLSAMSEAVRQVMLGAEDGRFFEHDGVDRIAIIRALWLNLRRGGIRSGASTITMQLVGLGIGRDRSWWRKFRQAGLARNLEWHHSKAWILEAYLNRIPFGGKVYGIEAAARHYFGLSAASLNLAEATLLCGLPQAPNRYRPDRHLERARRRQALVIRQLVSSGAVSEEEGVRIWEQEPLRFRDFRRPSPLRSSGHFRTEHFLLEARRECGDGFEVRTSWLPDVQEVLLSTLRHQVGRLEGVRDGAGLVADVASGEILALVGSLDYASPQAGQVNAAICRRGAGSTLKPFIYAEAIDGGLLCASTVMQDLPFRYGSYSPGNDSGGYRGEVTAREALSQSLNTPAIRLVARLGEGRVLEMLHGLGILHGGYLGQDERHQRQLGLSVGLGTSGARMVDLAGAYRLLAAGGGDHRLTYLKHGLRGRDAGSQVFTAGTCLMVSKMLSSREMPGGIIEAAWKTGTSTGNHDAWCFAYTREYVVGIWFGNKDGSGSRSLVGGTAAAPCASAVLEWLYRDRVPAEFGSSGTLLTQERLCVKSGLRARPGRCDFYLGERVAGIPLQECCQCLAGKVRAVEIMRPLPLSYVAGRDGKVRLPVVSRPARVLWYVDGDYRGELPASGRLSFGVGRHELRAVSEAEGVRPGRVVFEVQPYERPRARGRRAARE